MKILCLLIALFAVNGTAFGSENTPDDNIIIHAKSINHPVFFITLVQQARGVEKKVFNDPKHYKVHLEGLTTRPEQITRFLGYWFEFPQDLIVQGNLEKLQLGGVRYQLCELYLDNILNAVDQAVKNKKWGDILYEEDRRNYRNRENSAIQEIRDQVTRLREFLFNAYEESLKDDLPVDTVRQLENGVTDNINYTAYR